MTPDHRHFARGSRHWGRKARFHQPVPDTFRERIAKLCSCGEPIETADIVPPLESRLLRRLQR